MKRVTTHEAKTHLSKLIAEVEAGEEVLICRSETPVARLVALRGGRTIKRPKVGTRTSEPLSYEPSCFAPLTDEELKEWGLG